MRYLRSPAKNSKDNDWMFQVVGNKMDDEDGDSLAASLYKLNRHVHSPSKVYPTGAAGVQVTSGAGAWTLGNAATIIPANTVPVKFDIHQIIVEGASNNDTFEIVLYGNGTEIGRYRFTVLDIANSRILPNFSIQTSLLEKNSAVTARLMGAAGSRIVTISLYYHEY